MFASDSECAAAVKRWLVDNGVCTQCRFRRATAGRLTCSACRFTRDKVKRTARRRMAKEGNCEA